MGFQSSGDANIFIWKDASYSGMTAGGGCTPDAWDNESDKSKFFNLSTGAPVVNESTVSVDDTNAQPLTVNHGAGVTVVTGTLAWVQFSGTYDNGWYFVTYVDDNNVTLDGSNGTGVGGITCDISIGGVIKGISELLSSYANHYDATNYNMNCLVKGSETLTAQENIAAGGGSSTTRLRFIGVNSSWAEDGTRAVITTASSITSLIKITTIDYLEFRHIDFDGNSNATYCVYSVATDDGQHTTFSDCLIHGAVTDGLFMRSYYLQIINSSVYLNGRDGYGYAGSTTALTIIDSKFYNNNRHGIYHRSSAFNLIGNSIFDNGQGEVDGGGCVEAAIVTSATLIGNTAWSNYSDGFRFVTGSYWQVYINNTSVENGGYGYNFVGTSSDGMSYFSHNHASGNSSGHYNVDDDASFVDFMHGNNINGTQSASQLFVDAGNGDFTPKTDSELIDAGLDVGNGTQDIGAVQQEAGEGGGDGGGGTQILGGFIVR